MKSKLAVWSLIMSLVPVLYTLSLFFIETGRCGPIEVALIAFVIFSIVSIILGVVGLIKIKKNSGLEGKNIAVSGILIGILDIVLLIFVAYLGC